tara:strand:- start:971 stop:3082 length:2112 start_codon:yes stop_codon:yes gene_type:complete
MKILLGDPRHDTVGTHSSYVPINIGYIATYLTKKIPEIKFDIKIVTETSEIFDLIINWKPEVMALSNYVWNSTLSNRMCEIAKQHNPNILTILGGPEFPAGTGNRKIEDTEKDKTHTKCFNYLKERPSVDYFAYSDGEVVFFEIIKEFIKKNNSLQNLKKEDKNLPGCASISVNKEKLLVGKYVPRLGMEGSVKSEGRDEIPSPYLSGILDKFLNGKYVPAFETARGCPFLCTFCDQGIDESKITAFSTKRLSDEMWYVAKKIAKLKEGTKTICIYDANWGLFEKDIALADHIAEIMDEFDWPKNIHCSTPKNKRENLVKIDDKLKNRVQMGLAMQSMNTDVLSNIKRKNLATQKQIEMIHAIQSRGKTATTELIIPLPGETEKTYFDGMKFLMDNNVMTGTYTLMMLCGAELGRDEAIKKNKMISKYRILPKQFGDYFGKKVFEIEQVCVGTNTMSYQSYLNCRNFSFILQLLSASIFSPIYKLTQKLGISWHEVVKKTAELIRTAEFKGKFKDLYNEFCDEAEKELFDSKEEAISFYRKDENYELLLKGEIGENLLGKYGAKGFFVHKDIVETLFRVIKNNFNVSFNKDFVLILNSSEKWLNNLYMIDEIMRKDENQKNKSYKIELDFDFPSWLLNTEMPIENFKNHSIYEIDLNQKKIDYLKNEIKSIYTDDKLRALGRYFRQHMQRGSSVFEKNYQKIH